LNGLHGVDGTHSETEKTIGVGVLRKGGGNGGSSLNSLGRSGYTTNGDLVRINLARST
jgi:hypothetical protein